MCVDRGGGLEGHRVDVGCSWLNWEDRGWDGYGAPKFNFPDNLPSVTFTNDGRTHPYEKGGCFLKQLLSDSNGSTSSDGHVGVYE